MSDCTGVVLAGGAGRRLGGAKATTPLAGRPLIAYPLDALRAVLGDVAVVAKAGSPLPELPAGVARWTEPDAPRHPLAGIVAALGRAGTRFVVVLACDLPFVSADLVRALAEAEPRGRMALLARAGGRPQPLCARYERVPVLAALAGFDPAARATDAVLALGPAWLDADPALLRNVNTPAELAAAEAELA